MDAARPDTGGAADGQPDATTPAPCGKLTDSRPDCAACIASRCCAEAAVCSADPLCLACGANPLPSCAPYPPSATLTACLARCPGNPCGVPLDAGTGQTDAGGVDGRDTGGSTSDSGGLPDSGSDATSTDRAGGGDASDAASPPDAGTTGDAAAANDARPIDATATDARPDSDADGRPVRPPVAAVTRRVERPLRHGPPRSGWYWRAAPGEDGVLFEAVVDPYDAGDEVGLRGIWPKVRGSVRRARRLARRDDERMRRVLVGEGEPRCRREGRVDGDRRRGHRRDRARPRPCKRTRMAACASLRLPRAATS